MASEAVFDKAAMSVPFSNLIFIIFQAPGGAIGAQMALKIMVKTASILKLGLDTPGAPKPSPNWSKIGAKRLPGGVQMASNAIFNKAAISVPYSKLVS